MGVPNVVVVGRPNVGKSSVFNWLARKRLAVVDDQPGVTRDRQSYLMHAGERYFELVDTGGMGFEDPDRLTEQVEEQITAALDEASLVLFVVDTQCGRMPLDEQIAQRLRSIKAPVIFVANKTDTREMDPQANDFFGLGKGSLLRVSTIHNRGREELLEQILKQLPEEVGGSTLSEPVMKVATVGRPNTGKSTFVNTLAKAKRMIVSELPGTTRDSVDVRFELDGKTFVAIDTPGLQRTRNVKTDLGFYSMVRAQRSVRRADVTLLFFDASQRVAKADKELCSYIAEQYKPCIFVVNKWDLYAGAMPTEKWAQYLRDTFRNMWYAPIAFVTGQTGKNVKALLNHAQMLFRQSLERTPTAEINRVLREALERNPPPRYKGKEPKIYFGTQVGVQPPTIVLICNHPGAFDATYQRYLLGAFRERLPYSEVPIKLYLRRRESSDVDGNER